MNQTAQEKPSVPPRIDGYLPSGMVLCLDPREVVPSALLRDEERVRSSECSLCNKCSLA